MAHVRDCFLRVAFATFVVILTSSANAQYVSRNINMVSGTQWPGGDPFLQRQNEPSMSVSTRNPLHILAGANDYRTVDLPGLPDAEETGDAWLGLFISLDGGFTWRSTLVPGYPQDTTAPAEAVHQSVNGITFNAAADPMVRSGLNGMFYYSGIAMRRPATPASPTVSGVFVARYNDFNDREASNPIRYLGMSMVADGRNGSRFLDKPSLAVDVPRFGSSLCTAGGQTILGGNVYVVYTEITPAAGATTGAKLWFSRSTDCGSTWASPITISGNNTLNQGSTIAIDTRNGNVYVVWRRIASGTQSNALLVTKSTDGGRTFSAPVVIRNIVPYEQGTTGESFRTPMYPTAVTDADGRLYVAWSERTGATGATPGWSDLPDGRVMIANSPDGAAWSAATQVAPTAPIAPLSGRGQQFMPALSYASGKLMLVFYDAREDSTVGHYSWAPPNYTETRQVTGDLAAPQHFENVFNNYIRDTALSAVYPIQRRHTVDLRVAQATPGPIPVFEQSQRVSVYRFGYSESSSDLRQLEFNPPNLKMFKQGTVPFFGDYIDIAPQFPFLSSILNLPIPSPAFHAVWTDNRDVRPPVDGDWTNYTPPYSMARGASSLVDGSALAPCVADHTGMRNQNIYTSRITAGLFFGSPGNDKPLGTIQRAFVVTVQNSKAVAQSYRLQIVNQPVGGKATFQQLPLNASAVTTLDITVNAKSSASRSVFVTSSIKSAPVGVTVTEIGTIGGAPSPNALQSVAVLNPDPSSPDIGSPDIGSPDIGSTEVYTPDIGSPDIGSPDIGSPDIGSPDIGSPDIGSPDIGSPDIGSPDIGSPSYASPDIGSPDIGSPDIGSMSMTDTTWPVSNDGNTTASYTTKLLQIAPIPSDLKLQLILHQSYKTPVSRNCVLGTETHHILLNNIPNPTLVDSNATNIGSPDIGSPNAATVAIPPTGSVSLTVRIIDKAHKGRFIPATQFVTPVIVAHAVDTANLNSPNPQPDVSMVITTPSVPDGVTNVTYPTTSLTARFGIGALTWGFIPPIEGPALPPGLTLSTSGVISGIPATPGTYTFTVTVHDSAQPKQHVASRPYTIHVSNPLTFGGAELPIGRLNVPYKAGLTANGGLTPLHWSTTSGNLPPGIVMSDGGTFSGTPTAQGTYNFFVAVSDSSVPAQATQPVSVSITIQPQTFTVVAHMTYNAQPRTPTAPQFFLRNNDLNTVIPNSQIVWNQNDTVTISGLIAGSYGFEVTSPEAANAVRLPGSFYGFNNFDAATASVSGFNLTLTRLIHLTSPEDNNVADASFSCPPSLTYVGTNSISWDAIEIPATYSYLIQKVTCPFTNQTTVVSGSTAGTSATFPALAASGPNDYYVFTLQANSGSTFVGQIMTNAPNNGGWAWDLRFRVVDPLVITTTGPLADGFVNDPPYSSNITASGGTPPVHFAAIGALPAGLQLNDDGSITGSPSGVEYAAFDVKATDSGATPQTTTRRFAIQTWAPRSDYCVGGTFPLYNNWNGNAVIAGAVSPSIVVPSRPKGYLITGMATYHFASPVVDVPTLGLTDNANTNFGPYNVQVQPATSGFVNWAATIPTTPAQIIQGGTFSVNDSYQPSWAQNSPNREGFTVVCVTPN